MKTIVAENLRNENIAILPLEEQYVLGLLATEGKKNCSRMAEDLNISHHCLSEHLEKAANLDEYRKIIFDIARQFPDKVVVVGDDTAVTKQYVKILEGVWRMPDPCCKGNFVNAYTISVLGLRINNMFFPLYIDLFVPKDLAENYYRTKSKIMIDMIKNIMKEIEIDKLTLDGAYSTIEMISFLNQNQIKFDMRIASNRKVTLEDGSEIPIAKHPLLKKNRNSKAQTISCTWHSEKIYITAHFIKNKNEKRSVKYIVSNYVSSPVGHVKVYKLRWIIEEYFRFTKQNLGFSDCRAHKIDKHLNHITHVIKSYFVTQINALKKMLKKNSNNLFDLWHEKINISEPLIQASSLIFG